MALYSASFELSSFKRNADGDVVENGLKINESESIVVTGYGKNTKQALKNAFSAAVEQYVGVIVDSTTIAKNGKLISDEILTASNGYIESYKKLGVKKVDGLIEVKIKAVVKSQKVFEKIKHLHIATKTFNNSNDIYAKVLTKAQAKKNANKLLAKAFNDITSNKTLQNMVDVTIKKVKIDEDNAKDGLVPIFVTYQLQFNYKNYIKKVEQLEELFKSLGAICKKRYDLVKKDQKTPYNSSRLNKLKTNNFLIMKKYGRKYKVDAWFFPKYTKELPLQRYGDLNFDDNFQVVLEIKDAKSEVLLSESTHQPLEGFEPLTSHLNTIYAEPLYDIEFQSDRLNILRPYLIDESKDTTKKIYTQKVMLEIEQLAKIKNITIELEELF